ncbi:MAG: hypothetical protein ACM3MN_07485, partial [Nitrospirota bacterium]
LPARAIPSRKDGRICAVAAGGSCIMRAKSRGDSGMIVALALFLLVVCDGAAAEEERYRIARQKEYYKINPP